MSIADSLPLLALLSAALLLSCFLLWHSNRERVRKKGNRPLPRGRRLDASIPIIQVTRPSNSAEASALWHSLTTREKQVARLAARGLSNAEIAAALGIKSRTVDAHLQSIYGKLQVRSRTQLAHRFRDLVD